MKTLKRKQSLLLSVNLKRKVRQASNADFVEISAVYVMNVTGYTDTRIMYQLPSSPW